MENQIVFLKTFKLIEAQTRKFAAPWVEVESRRRDPYRVLVSCILSLRTKDETTARASKRLFKVADTPAAMIKLAPKRMQSLIYPVGFYRNKSKSIIDISHSIIREHDGRVPDDLDSLLSLKGVGRKTANLVLSQGFNKPAVCVDTHVQRISNRLGWVDTVSPEETETKLMEIFPRQQWSKLNSILVKFGQNICKPVSPWCSRCLVNRHCPKRGVSRNR